MADEPEAERPEAEEQEGGPVKSFLEHLEDLRWVLIKSGVAAGVAMLACLERKSLVLTTNLAFSQWPGIFPNATSATALIDRVIHHSEIIAIEGDSYRKREAEAAQKRRRTKPAA